MIGYSFEFVGLSGNRSKLINLAFWVVCRCGLAIGVAPSGYTDIDLEWFKKYLRSGDIVGQDDAWYGACWCTIMYDLNYSFPSRLAGETQFLWSRFRIDLGLIYRLCRLETLAYDFGWTGYSTPNDEQRFDPPLNRLYFDIWRRSLVCKGCDLSKNTSLVRFVIMFRVIPS